MAPVSAGTVGTFDAVLLTGGTGRRLGGVDKAQLRLDGVTLLDRGLAATSRARRRVVVGPPTPTRERVTFVREEPPGSGPGAGFLAGLDALHQHPGTRRTHAAGPDGAADWVAVLAVDMPYVTAATLDRLQRAARDQADGAFLTDAEGRRQLCAIVSTARITAQDPGPEQRRDCAFFGLFAGLRLVEVPAHRDGAINEAVDLDTPGDVPPTLEW